LPIFSIIEKCGLIRSNIIFFNPSAEGIVGEFSYVVAVAGIDVGPVAEVVYRKDLVLVAPKGGKSWKDWLVLPSSNLVRIPGFPNSQHKMFQNDYAVSRAIITYPIME